MIESAFTMQNTGAAIPRVGRVLRQSGANTCEIASDPADPRILGPAISGITGRTGGAVGVCQWGLIRLQTGAAVTFGQLLTTDSVGRLVAVSSGSNQIAVARALESSGGAGEIIDCLTFPPICWNGGPN